MAVKTPPSGPKLFLKSLMIEIFSDLLNSIGLLDTINSSLNSVKTSDRI